MIRVRDVGEPREVTVTIGAFVCLTLKWQASPLMGPAYWRPGDHHGSLMEVGIHPETGILLSLSIVLPGDGVEVRDEPDASPERRGVQGHPLIDLAPWGRKVRLDEIVPFRLIVYEHWVSIWFVSPDEAESDLVSERVRFHLSAGENSQGSRCRASSKRRSAGSGKRWPGSPRRQGRRRNRAMRKDLESRTIRRIHGVP